MSELDRRLALHLLHGQVLLIGLIGPKNVDAEGMARVEEYLDAAQSLASELEDEIIDEEEEFYPSDDV